jgi:hypothetical protein
MVAPLRSGTTMLFVPAMAVAFAIVHSPTQFLHRWYESVIRTLLSADLISKATADASIAQTIFFMQQYMAPLRTLMFFSAIAILFYPLVRSAIAHFREHPARIFSRKNIMTVFGSFAVISILVFPLTLGIMAEGYAQVSIDPLGVFDNSNQVYQRILMPAMAYFLQCKGPLLYHLFSIGITVVLMLFIVIYFDLRGIVLTSLELISIGTSSFMITQFQSPGYTEPLAYLLLLLLFVIPTDSLARMSIVVLSILAHEVSAVVMTVIALFYFTKEEKVMTFSIFGMYAFFWLLSFGFDLRQLIQVRNVGEESALTWLLRYPLREVFGIFISFKLLWIVIGLALVKMSNDRFVIIGMITAAVFLTFGGVDTSRLMGYMFIAVLLSYYSIRKYSLVSETTLKYILFLNIVIPSYYVGTNVGPVQFNGLYQLLFDGSLLR